MKLADLCSIPTLPCRYANAFVCRFRFTFNLPYSASLEVVESVFLALSVTGAKSFFVNLTTI